MKKAIADQVKLEISKLKDKNRTIPKQSNVSNNTYKDQNLAIVYCLSKN